MLESEGAYVVCAQNGKETVELFEESTEGKYDASLMDIRMLVMNEYLAKPLDRQKMLCAVAKYRIA